MKKNINSVVRRIVNSLCGRREEEQARYRAPRGRALRMEALESRELLDVSPAEWAEIRAKYADLDLSASANIIEIEAEQISRVALDNAIRQVGDDSVIVVRTTDSNHTITLSTQIEIDAPGQKIAIVSYGTQNLVLDGNKACRVLTVFAEEFRLGGVDVINGLATRENTRDSWFYEYWYWHLGRGHESAAGGGILAGGQLFLDKCRISNNVADDDGTALKAINVGTYNEKTLAGVFSSAVAMGGGICSSDATYITNCIISNNYTIARTGVSENWSFPGIDYLECQESAYSEGGGFYIADYGVIMHSVITNNASLVYSANYYEDDLVRSWRKYYANSSIGLGSNGRSYVSNNGGGEMYSGGIINSTISHNKQSLEFKKQLHDFEQYEEVVYSRFSQSIIGYGPVDPGIGCINCSIIGNVLEIDSNAKNYLEPYYEEGQNEIFENCVIIDGDDMFHYRYKNSTFNNSIVDNAVAQGANNYIYNGQSLFTEPDSDGYYPLSVDSFAKDKGNPKYLSEEMLQLLLDNDENGILNLGAYKITRNKETKITLSDFTVKCANDKIPSHWGVVVEEPVNITVTANVPNANVTDDYTLKTLNLELTAPKLDKYGEPTGEEIKYPITVDLTKDDTDDTITVKPSQSKKYWTISYKGWIPKKDENGNYTVKASLSYERKAKLTVTDDIVSTFTVNQPKLEVADIKLTCVDPKIAKDRAIVKEEARFKIKLREATGVFDPRDYSQNKDDYTVRLNVRIEEDEDDDGMIIWAKNPDILHPTVTVTSLENLGDYIVLTCDGWTPTEDQYGRCEIEAEVDYHLNPIAETNIASSNVFFTSVTLMDNSFDGEHPFRGEIDTNMYYLYFGRVKTQQEGDGYVSVRNGTLERSQQYGFKKLVADGAEFDNAAVRVVSIKREDFNELIGDDAWKELSTFEQWKKIRSYLEEYSGYYKLGFATGVDGALPEFYDNFTDYYFSIVLSRKEVKTSKGISTEYVKRKDVKDYIYMPDASNLGYYLDDAADIKTVVAPDSLSDYGDAVLEQLVRTVPEFRSNSRAVWKIGDLVFFTTQTPKSPEARGTNGVFSGTTDINITPYYVTYRADKRHEGEGIFSLLGNGFQAVGLTNASSGKEPTTGSSSLFMARGTEDTINDKIFADTFPEGVGVSQYKSSKPEINAWANHQSTIITAGHSLGGALAQLFASDNAVTNKIQKVVTFQSAGVSSDFLRQFQANVQPSCYVRHYVANGDDVSISGENFLTVLDDEKVATVYSFGDYSSYDATGKYDRASQVYKHNTWLLNPTLFKKSSPTWSGTPQLEANLTVKEYSSFWFHYTVPGVLGVNQFDRDSLFIRSRAESARREAGELFRNKKLETSNIVARESEYQNKGIINIVSRQSVESPSYSSLSNSGWRIERYLGSALGSSTSEPAQGWKALWTNVKKQVFGDVIRYRKVYVPNEKTPGCWSVEYFTNPTITMPGGLTFPAKMVFPADFHLVGALEVETNETTEIGVSSNTQSLIGAVKDKLTPNKYLYLSGGSKLALNKDGLEALNNMRPNDKELPDYQFIFDASPNSWLYLGGADSTKLAEIELSTLSGKGNNALFGAKSVKLTRGGSELPIELGEGKLTLTPNKRLSGENFTGTLTIGDGALSEALTLSDVKIRLESALGRSDQSTVTGVITNSNEFNGATFILQSTRKSVTLKIITSVKTYNYYYRNGRFEGHLPEALPENDASPKLSNALLATGVGSSIAQLSATSANAQVTILLTPSDAQLARDSFFSFYLSATSSGDDGVLIDSLALAEMTDLGNGQYSYTFDLSDCELADGDYYVYGYDFLTEDASAATYSGVFQFEAPTPQLSVSTSTLDFGDAHVGEFNSQEVVVTNTGETTARFAIEIPNGDALDYYVYGVDSQGNGLESPYVDLEPGESITLTVYFAPSETGARSSALNLVTNNNKPIESISLTSNGQEMAETTLETPAENAVVSSDVVTWGDFIDVSCDIVNTGGSVLDFATVTFYITADPNDITSGKKLGEYNAEHWLAPGETLTATLDQISVPELTDGEYYLAWTLNASNLTGGEMTGVSSNTITVGDGAILSGSVTLRASVDELTASSAVAGTTIATVSVENIANPSFSVLVADVASDLFVVEGGALKLARTLDVGEYRDIVVVAKSDALQASSAPITITVVADPVVVTPPLAPNYFQLTHNAPTNSLTLTWSDRATDETGYRVEYLTPTGWQELTQLTANATSFAVSLAGYPYGALSFRVGAYNDGGTAYSSPATFTHTAPSVTPPTAPTNFQLTHIPTTNALTLTWSDRATDETGYRVEYLTPTGWQAFAQLPANATSYAVSLAGYPYGALSFRVGAYNDGGTAYSSSATFTYASPNPPATKVPEAPTGLTFDYDATSDSLTVSWTDVATTEQGYLVQFFGENSSFTSQIRTKADATSVVLDFANRSAVESGMLFISVWSYNDAGRSGALRGSYDYQAPLRAPTAPGALRFRYDATAQKLNLYWLDRSSTEDGYRIEVSSDVVIWTTLATVNADALSCAVPLANKPQGTLYYRVVAFNSVGDSDSIERAFETGPFNRLPSRGIEEGQAFALTVDAAPNSQVYWDFGDGVWRETGAEYMVDPSEVQFAPGVTTLKCKTVVNETIAHAISEASPLATSGVGVVETLYSLELAVQEANPTINAEPVAVANDYAAIYQIDTNFAGRVAARDWRLDWGDGTSTLYSNQSSFTAAHIYGVASAARNITISLLDASGVALYTAQLSGSAEGAVQTTSAALLSEQDDALEQEYGVAPIVAVAPNASTIFSRPLPYAREAFAEPDVIEEFCCEALPVDEFVDEEKDNNVATGIDFALLDDQDWTCDDSIEITWEIL